MSTAKITSTTPSDEMREIIDAVNTLGGRARLWWTDSEYVFDIDGDAKARIQSLWDAAQAAVTKMDAVFAAELDQNGEFINGHQIGGERCDAAEQAAKDALGDVAAALRAAIEEAAAA